ncbi:MAG: ABC transporter permease [Opitutales bacterium]
MSRTQIQSLLWQALPAIGGLIILVLWVVLKEAAGLQDFILPQPNGVLEAMWTEREVLLRGARQTFVAAILGFVTAVTLAYIMSLILTSAAWIRQMWYPWVIIFKMVPVIILIPIFVLWMGPGIYSIIAVTFMISFFPVVANTTMGLESTDRNLVDLFTMLNASKAQEMLYLRIPNSMPYFLTGLKIAGVLAPIGAITGDLFVGQSADGQAGLGLLVTVYNGQLKSEELYATAAVASILGLVFVGTVNFLHWYFLHNWHESAVKEK